MIAGGGSLSLRLAVCAVYSAALIGLAVAPTLPTAAAGVSDKVVHGAAYGVHAAVLGWALEPLLSPLGALLLGWLGAGFLGAATELLQNLSPRRSADLADLGADVLGATLAVLVVLVCRRLLDLRRTRARSLPHAESSTEPVSTQELR